MTELEPTTFCMAREGDGGLDGSESGRFTGTSWVPRTPEGEPTSWAILGDSGAIPADHAALGVHCKKCI